MDKVFFTIIILIVGGLVFLLIDALCSTNKYIGTGTVVEKAYSPEETSTGTGYGVGANGNSGIIITTTHKDEEYILFVNMNGRFVKTKTKMSDYIRSKNGDEMKVYHAIGLITGWTWETYSAQNGL
jgi:hypothetical protein